MNKRRLAAALAVCFAGMNHVAAAQVIPEFPMPRSGGAPLQIAPGPGGMWFTEPSANRIGLITPEGNVSEFPVSRPPIAIVSGRDGNLWFTSTGFVSKMTPEGVVTDFQVNRLSSEGYPSSIALGPDGRLWFTDWDSDEGGHIGQVTVSGKVTYGAIPDGIVEPTTITTGPDGNLWFTESLTNKIGRITPSGIVTEFAVSGSPRGIARGYDGNLWFTESTGNRIGRITTRGEVTDFPIPTANAEPWGIAAGLDGNIWFTERGAGQIGKVRTDDVFPPGLRLGGDRFRVQVLYWVSPSDEENPNGGGYGVPVALTSNAGYFWFSDPANVEVVVKILDWCPDGGIRFFAAGLTNFRVEVDVTDTQTGLTKHYTNPQGAAFQPIQDVFSSCAPSESIAGTWTGTYNSTEPLSDCDVSILNPAQATLWQNGSSVGGTLTVTGDDPRGCPPRDSLTFTGTLQGSVLTGTIKFPDFSWFVRGALSGSQLDIAVANVYGTPFGVIHLHR